MGWTWRAGADMLKRYPTLAENKKLMERWPQLRAAVQAQEGPEGPGGTELAEGPDGDDLGDGPDPDGPEHA